MKSILFALLSTIVLVTNGQKLIADKFGDVIPLSTLPEYKDKIDWTKVNSLDIGEYNNDSLCIAKNGVSLDNLRASKHFSGIPIDTSFLLTDVATEIKLKKGSLYLFIIKSNTAPEIYAGIKNFNIPKGGYFCYRPDKSSYIRQDLEAFSHLNPNYWDKGQFLGISVHAQQLILEYYIPKGYNGETIKIENIAYGFVGLGKKKTTTSISGGLKSGGHGTAQNDCQHDVACPEVNGWLNEASTECYIELRSIDGSKLSKGSGVFLNKVNNYLEDEYPIILTAGHLFNEFENATITVYVHYKNETCNDTKIYKGISIGSVERVETGLSYNVDPNNSFYVANNDFAILQTNRNRQKLDDYQVRYAGWDANNYVNSYKEGYAGLGHPGGDVMKVNYTADGAVIPPGWDYFALYFQMGLTEHGFSGGPIFGEYASSNEDRKVVGWMCTGDSETMDCLHVGSHRTKCGFLDALSIELAYYIDPEMCGEANASQPYEPPIHCSNCVLDSGEEMIDCGGECPPCYDTKDEVIISNNEQMFGGNIYAKTKIALLPESTLKSSGVFLTVPSSSSLKSGKTVVINNGTQLMNNTEIIINKDIQLNPPSRGCGDICFWEPNVFTPNGDGINDYWVFFQSFVTSYNIYIYGLDCRHPGMGWWEFSYDRVFLERYNVPVTENGFVDVWDGPGDFTCSGNMFYYELTAYGCGGRSKTREGYIQIFNKSATITSISDSLIYESLLLFPNPTKDNIIIELPFQSNKDIDYIIINSSGIVMKSGCFNNYTQIDISDFELGAYLIKIVIDNKVLTGKIIKD